ncbi:hypothetical protein BGZ95_011886 [Linnemannia exigua]|uniref:Tyrosine specific protein phosphatases domain-containing protein n=1 Tax=Linnemannia exigua TaxID=604196 RepID=A0AAD4DJX1_9FUNG|nr:hypothetical protein BGZ95_011886 [Linnemannia exigua]
MAAFHSLSPSLGSHQARQAPDLFSIELELELPQDHFLPAQDIQAQVWTNIIHKLNPDGPEVWAALPMKLSHVIPGKSIAVFATRFQPTGRGEFGLTARWKSHKDMTEWQWAPTEIPVSGGEGGDKQGKGNNNNNMSGKWGDEEEGKKKNRDVSVTVRVPRTIAGTSSWTIGPQSVLVYGEHGLRTSGVVGVGGPGLYLGNHAAATRARISGYESVLSLVGDLLDFDENIPESDKDINKNAWMEQAQATSPPKRFSVLSRSSSIAALDSSDAEGYPQQQANSGGGQQGLNRRSSVTDFMRNYNPGSDSNSDAIIAGVVNDPVDPPRLTRKSSVTEMMVQLPSASAGPNSKRMIRSSASVSSIASIDEFDAAETPHQKAPVAATSAAAASAKNGTSATANGKSLNKPASTTSGATHPLPPAATAASAATTTATTATPTPPLSRKAQKAAAAAEKAAAAAEKAAAEKAAANPSAALPPVSGNSKTTKPAGVSTEGVTPPSPTVTSLAVSPAPVSSSPHPLDRSTATPSPPPNSDNPPSSAKVVSGLYRQGSFDSTQMLPSLSDSSTNGNSHKKKIPFSHKIISVAPGAHNKISDAILKEAVEFLQQELEQGKKVLVHCRDGNGRSGSVAVAYIASQLKKQQPWRNAGEGYQQALNEVWKWKCDVYPHKGLRQSVEQIRW